MAAIAQPDVFQQAHQDAQRAVATFLPSLTPQPPAPPAPPPSIASPKIQEAVRAMSIVRKVEMTSKRVARGLPPEPPPPPSPQETFPPAIDQVHIRAMAAAIAAHPETDRPALLQEAHQNLTKWIASKNGQVAVDGHIEIADSPQSAEKLAARIVNQAVDDHDQREKAKKESALGGVQADVSGRQGIGKAGASSKSHSRTNRTSTDSSAATGVPEAVGGGVRNNVRSDDGSNTGSQPKGSEGNVSGAGTGGSELRPENLQEVGGVDPETGRTVTQTSSDLDEAQDQATAAAPELKDTLGQAVEDVPDASVDGVRESKEPDRAQQKVEAEGKPVHTQSDLLAGRIAVDSPEAKDQVVDKLKSSAPVIDEEDNFQDGDPDYGFRAHPLQVALGKGKTSAEVQVVPKEIVDADDDTHDTYERGRQAEAEGDDETAQQAMDENKAAHDKAMEKFTQRNQDRGSKIVDSLTGAGFKVQGKPVKIGGHLFVPVVDDDA